MKMKTKKLLAILICSLMLITTLNIFTYSEIFAENNDDGSEDRIVVPVDDVTEAPEEAPATPVTINLVIPFSHDGYKFPTKTVTLNAGEKLSSNEDARAYIEDFRRISYYLNVRPKTWKDQEDHTLTNAQLLEKPQDKDATYTIYESERKLIYTFNYIDGREKERRPADYASYKIPTQGTIKNTELNKYVKINFIEQKGNTLQNAKFDQFEHFHAQLIGEAIVEHNKPGKFNEFYEWEERNENKTVLDDQMRIRDFLNTVSMSGTNGGYANFQWRMTFRTILKISDASKDNPKDVHYKTVFTDYNKDGAVVTKRDFDVTLNSTSTRLPLGGRDKVFGGQSPYYYPEMMALQTSAGYGSNNPLVLGKRSLDFEWPEDLKTNYKLVVSGSHEMGDFVDKMYSFYRRVVMTVDNGDGNTSKNTVYQGQKVSEGDNVEGLTLPTVQEGKIFRGWKLDDNKTFTTVEALKNFVVTSGKDFTIQAQYEIDKSNLIAKIKEGKTKLGDADQYTPSSIAKLQEAITAGETERDSKTSTVESVGTAITNIDKAIANLKPRANVDQLKKLVGDVEGLDENLYTPDSFKKLEEPLKNAKAILENPDAEQSAVDKAYEELKAAKDQLKQKADKNTLNKLIEEAKGKKEKDYLPNSMKGLPAAIEAAKKIALDDNATDQDVNGSIEKLQEELNKLVPRPDKSELQELIETAKGKEADKYTEDSYTNLQKELEKAKLVNDDDNADADQVGEAIESLKNALEKLQEKPEEIRTSIPTDYPTAQPLPVFPINEVPEDTTTTTTTTTTTATTTTTTTTTTTEPEETTITSVTKPETTTTTVAKPDTTSTTARTGQETSLTAGSANNQVREQKTQEAKKKQLPKTGESMTMSRFVLLVVMFALISLRVKLKRDEKI